MKKFPILKIRRKEEIAKSGNDLVVGCVHLPKSKYKHGEEVEVEIKIRKTGRIWDGYKMSFPKKS